MSFSLPFAWIAQETTSGMLTMLEGVSPFQSNIAVSIASRGCQCFLFTQFDEGSSCANVNADLYTSRASYNAATAVDEAQNLLMRCLWY